MAAEGAPDGPNVLVLIHHASLPSKRAEYPTETGQSFTSFHCPSTPFVFELVTQKTVCTLIYSLSTLSTFSSIALKRRSCWCDRFRMAWRRSSHATIDARLSELELISPRGGFRFTLPDGDDRKVLNRKLPRDKVLGLLAALPACDGFGSNLRLRHPVGQWPLFACAVRRRRFPVGASPTRRTLQPEATGAVMEVTKWLKPSV